MIKNLLFDLGGVIMDLDRDRSVRAFEKLGMKDADDFLGVYGQKGAFLALESGQIGPDEFHREVRAIIGRDDIPDGEIDAAFTEFLDGIPVHRLESLRELAKTYRICMLSNTNPIMFNGRIAEEFRKEGLEMKDYFDGIFTSYEAKCCKPGKAIFDYTEREGGLVPSETLFFDDSQSNVDAARSYGFNAVLVKPGDEFAELLKEFIS